MRKGCFKTFDRRIVAYENRKRSIGDKTNKGKWRRWRRKKEACGASQLYARRGSNTENRIERTVKMCRKESPR